MQAISTALNRLLEEGAWFTRAKELRLLVVRVSADLRKTALQLLAGFEFHHDNRSAWLILEDSHSAKDPGWQVRANRLLAHWEDRRKAFREREGIEMPEAQPRAAAQPFAAACAAVLAASRPPLEGFVIVLAPAVVESVEAMGVEIEALLKDRAIGSCRWVWLIDADQPWPSLFERLGSAALRCECIPDPTQQKKDFEAMMSAAPIMIGRAGPRGVAPPPRIDDPPALPPEQRDAILREAGINPAYLEKAPELQRLIFGAAIAMKYGKGEEALRQQREACEVAASLELNEVTMICRVALSSYLSGLGQRDEALAELSRAIQFSQEHKLGLQEAQAHLAVGLLLALDQRLPEAAEAYAACARCAEAAGVPVLGIEGWRMAGQIRLQAREEQRAIDSFREAIRVAEKSDPSTVQSSTASEAARTLAALYIKLNLRAQADSLIAQADAMDRGEIGVHSVEKAEA